jgi:SAM-dependent methyltransferase
VSKRDDDSASDMEVGMTTAERRRRRRRGGSLRVPSDNVPRRTNPPVVAPVPEDPSLAMSIAYSFGSEAAETIARVDVHDGRKPIVSVDDNGSAPIGFDPEAPEAIPTMIDPPSPQAPETSDFEMKTREMTAVDLEALGLTEPGKDGDPGTTDPHLPGVGLEVRFKPQRPRRESGPDVIERAPSDGERASSVEVDMDGLDGLEGNTNPDGQTVIVEADEPPLPRAATQPPIQAVQAAPAKPVRERKERLKTVALTDEDLEEVREAVRAATGAAPAAVSPPPSDVPVPIASDASKPIAMAAAAQAPTAPAPGPASVLSDKARAELERVTRELDPSAPPPAATPPAAPLKDAISNRTQPLSAVDINEIDKNEIESEEPLSVPDIDIQELADRASSSGEYEVDINDDDEPAAASLFGPSPNAAAAPTPPPAPVEAKRERSPSTPPPIAPAPASTTPGTGLSPQPPAPPHKDHAQPPAPPPAALAHAPAKTPPTPPPAPAKKETKPSPPAATRTTTTDGKMAPRGKPWFVDLFDEDYLRTLPFLTPQATQAEAEFVIDAMGLTPGAQVLDVGCGYGRHAMELAARGFHVVGLDLSTPLLVRGGEEAQRRGLQINFVRGDMRELDFEAQFDAAYCLFSTFGYFDDETNKKTIANIARALKPGGRVMIEILNRDYLITDLPTRVWWEGDGCVVLEEVELNYFSSRIQVNRSVVFDDGRQLEQEISVRAYSLHEVGKLMHAAGFRVLEVSGGYHTRSRFFGNQSRHIIVLAERKEAPPS